MRSRSGVLLLAALPSPGLPSRLWTALVVFMEQRRDRRALADMDIHLLRDIGLHRSQIEAAVRDGRT